ncbi:hypothetical protein [Nonomuraea lactucae]|uniref:hypothetical protein n=1 Tax=Nonomuraea lactucae TaxID=2249762 RepID=UPI0013B3C136|nr:hypothetical protein [Nonomuraea lactucae]
MRGMVKSALAIVAAAGIAMSAAGAASAAAPSVAKSAATDTKSATAGSSHTQKYYTLKIRPLWAGFTADYCLLSGRDFDTGVKAQCSGNKPGTGIEWESFTITVPYNDGDIFWLDINVVAGKDYKRNIIKPETLKEQSCKVTGPINSRPSITCR